MKKNYDSMNAKINNHQKNDLNYQRNTK